MLGSIEVEARLPEVHKLHVVTYVFRPGEKEPDVAAQQVLQTPADPNTGVEGDATKAVLSHAENFQCAGEHGTDGCTKCHAHAEERVIARLIENDRVAVAWRKYHPLAAKGTVKPGEPFEAEHDGLKVRVEARVVTEEDGEVLTNKAVSMVALRNLEGNLKKQQERGKLREQMRQQVDQFATGTYDPQRQAFEALADQTKDLPGAAAVLKTARDAFDQILRDARDGYLGLANDDALDAAKAGLLPATLQQVGQRIAAALAPVQQLEANGRALAQAQVEVRKVVDSFDALTDQIAAQKKNLPGLDDKGLPSPDLKKRGEAILEQSRKDAALTPADLVQQARAFDAELAARTAAFAQLLDAEQTKHDAFDARIDVFRQLKDGTLAKNLSSYVESCGAAEGFNTKHWLAVVEKAIEAVAGKAPDVDALSYHLPADQKKLAAAEQKTAPLTKAIADIDADVKKRIDPFPVHDVRGHQLVPPSVWIKVDEAHADGSLDVTVHARNNGAHSLRMVLDDGNHKALGTLELAKKGEHASIELKGVGSTFGAKLDAVGPEFERAPALIKQVDACAVHAASIHVIGKGSVGHLLPLYFTPEPNQPNTHARVNLPVDARITLLKIPGA